ncbi:hypothetical protein MMC07_005064 [Pseudocyphellaria aurata]|nr:hypothetical protein [Pseudocyphellaria aurata]
MSTQQSQLPSPPPEYQETPKTPDLKGEPLDHEMGVDPRPMDEAEDAHDDQKSESGPKWSPIREVTFIVIICSAQFLTQSGLGQTIFPLNLIGHSFGRQTPGQLSWYIAAYSLTVGTFILIAGRLGDMFGHKLLVIVGFSWFAFWSLIAGLSVYSHSPIFFDVCRALQGVGPAMLLPNSLAVLGRTYSPGRRKEMAFSLFGAAAPCGAVIGGAVSSLIAERSWWPWAYWCMAIVCSLAGGCAFFVIPPTPVSRSSDQSFDVWGSITGVAGLVLMNAAWNQAPVVGWNTPYVIVLLILGAILLLAFFMVERKVGQPLVPFRALSGKAGFVLGCIALGWSSFGIWLLYLLQFLQVLRNVTPLESAAQFAPTAIVGFIAAVITGVLLSRMRTSYIMAIAMTSFCVGIILPATMPIEQTYWIQTFLSMIVTVWGMDMSFPAATVLLSNLVPKGQQGVAASLVATVVNYSISIGLGIAGTVESRVSDGGNEVLRGYRGAWYAGIGLSGMGVLLSVCFILDESRKTARTEKA